MEREKYRRIKGKERRRGKKGRKKEKETRERRGKGKKEKALQFTFLARPLIPTIYGFC